MQTERQHLEPKLVAFEFKTEFNEKGEARVTSNWKTQNGWQEEALIDETDWLDEQTGREFLSKCFFHSFVLHYYYHGYQQ